MQPGQAAAEVHNTHMHTHTLLSTCALGQHHQRQQYHQATYLVPGDISRLRDELERLRADDGRDERAVAGDLRVGLLLSCVPLSFFDLLVPSRRGGLLSRPPALVFVAGRVRGFEADVVRDGTGDGGTDTALLSGASAATGAGTGGWGGRAGVVAPRAELASSPSRKERTEDAGVDVARASRRCSSRSYGSGDGGTPNVESRASSN